MSCIECGIDIKENEKYFCSRCYWLHSNIHIRLRTNGTCMHDECNKTGVDVFTWTKCSHTACVECYKNTPHQVIYEVERMKNPNTRCPICAKNVKESSIYNNNGGTPREGKAKQGYIQTKA